MFNSADQLRALLLLRVWPDKPSLRWVPDARCVQPRCVERVGNEAAANAGSERTKGMSDTDLARGAQTMQHALNGEGVANATRFMRWK